MTDTPTPPSDPLPPPGSPPGGGPVDPSAAVSLPALFLMIVGGLYFVGFVINLLRLILGLGLGAAARASGGNMLFTGVTGMISLAFTLLLGGVILFGGLKMRQLQSYNLAMAGAVAAMLPCTCCCIIGLPVGIWALVVLLKPEVKAAFH